MKVPPRQADAFVRSPPSGISAILIYGPDSGLVRERAEAAALEVAGDLSDPFRVVEFSANALRDEPTRLMDEATALSMTGGRRVVRVRDGGEILTSAAADLLQSDTGDTLIVIDAGDLSPRSKLRAVFEKADRGAAVACYLDDGAGLEALIRSTLGDAGISADRNTISWIAGNLGSDRAVSRMELEKLVLYAGERQAVTIEEAREVIGDSATVTFDDVANSACSGRLADLTVALARARFEGIQSVAILRAVQRHLTRLETCVAAVSRGMSAEEVVSKLRPPVFYKLKPGFVNQVTRWRPAAIGRARTELLKAEMDCKTTGLPDEAVCERALMRIAALSGAKIAR